MPADRSGSTAASETIARLAQPARLYDLGPIAGRFVHALRLVALYQRAKSDPVPELATRLGSLAIASRALALSQAIVAAWPETIHVSRFCCGLMSHDEATIGALVDCAANRDRDAFDAVLAGLVRCDRMERLWQAALDLVTAELGGA